MIERQARDLEVRVRVPVQVQIFLLEFDDENCRENSMMFITRISPCVVVRALEMGPGTARRE